MRASAQGHAAHALYANIVIVKLSIKEAGHLLSKLQSIGCRVLHPVLVRFSELALYAFDSLLILCDCSSGIIEQRVAFLQATQTGSALMVPCTELSKSCLINYGHRRVFAVTAVSTDLEVLLQSCMLLLVLMEVRLESFITGLEALHYSVPADSTSVTYSCRFCCILLSKRSYSDGEMMHGTAQLVRFIPFSDIFQQPGSCSSLAAQSSLCIRMLHLFSLQCRCPVLKLSCTYKRARCHVTFSKCGKGLMKGF